MYRVKTRTIGRYKLLNLTAEDFVPILTSCQNSVSLDFSSNVAGAVCSFRTLRCALQRSLFSFFFRIPHLNDPDPATSVWACLLGEMVVKSDRLARPVDLRRYT